MSDPNDNPDSPVPRHRPPEIREAGAFQLDLFADAPRPQPKFHRTAEPPKDRPPPVSPLRPHPDSQNLRPLYLPKTETPAPSASDAPENFRSGFSPKPRVHVGPSIPIEPDGSPRIVTDIYRNPNRRPAPESAPPEAPAPDAPGNDAPPPPPAAPWKPVFAWLGQVPLPRSWRLGFFLALLLVALLATLASRPRTPSAPEPAGPEPAAVPADLPEAPPATPSPDLPSIGKNPGNLPNLGKSPEAPANPPASSPDPSPGRTPPPDPVPAPDWKIPHAIALQYPDHVAIRFDIPVFVSADNISKEGGMDIVNALAAKLRQRKDSLLVTVTGHTDDEQITNPNAKYRTNADLAAARAHQVRDHLEVKSRPNSRLSFREETAPPEAAPYPNDTPANRRLNRTVTLRIEPAP